VTPDLAIKGATRAIDFYKKVFGAQEITRAPGPDGRSILHAELRIGDAPVFLADVFPDMAPQDRGAVRGTEGAQHSRVVPTVYVKDADAVFDRAVKAGAEIVMPLADAFWGDRYGQVRDRYGHIWAIATHKEDLTPEEVQKRSAAFFASMKR
jgi:uncharacterized glyoxalase superfamily protein PhnB